MLLKRPLFIALLIALPFAAQARELAAARVLAVYFYADWCDSCIMLEPKINDVRTHGEMDKKAVLFITLNLTDKTTINQATMLAEALGIGNYFKKQDNTSGYIILLDAISKKELARFDHQSTAREIQNTIENHLQGVE
jgi:thiol:disulfide interchange protein